MRKILCSLLFGLVLYPMGAQVLRPGFDRQEYIELLKIAQRQHTDVGHWRDTSSGIPAPAGHEMKYRSRPIGLSNMWDLWISTKDPVAVISIRGTTSDPASWLANFYAAMVPARGQLKISKTFVFDYALSSHPQAAVHVGWLVSLAFISGEVLPRIDSCYKQGIREFILTGHSQGGAITYLLSAYLHSLQSSQKLPADIRFKTVCSAAPKPGNLYFAYSYEHMTRGGWGLNVVNTADWVPEVPFSIQTMYDFNKTSLFTVAGPMIRQQKFPVKPAMKRIYRKLTRPGIKARKNYTRYMGKMASRSVKKLYPEFEAPVYSETNNYVRTGSTVVLYADEAYYRNFPDSDTNIWVHHFIQPYLFLTNRLNE